LHTPGGDLAATESLIHYLREMFDDIRAVVPQIAMSAGTIVACACQIIIMGKHSNLGPVDPQFGGIPAIGVINEIEMAFREIKDDQRAALVWNPILSRLPPSFVQQCHWAIERSKEYLELALKEGNCNYIDDENEKAETIRKIATALTDLSHNKSHNRHFHYQECDEMGLNVSMIENEFDGEYQDLVLTVHHCYIDSLANTPAFKIIESHKGQAFIKQQVQQFMFQMPPGQGA
jgi:membrane-bound ClpP family serine protease